MKLVFQDFPPSSENDSVYECELGAMSDQVARTRMLRSLNVSCCSSSTLPSLSAPVVAEVITPNLLLMNVWLHCCDLGLKRKRVSASQCPFGPSASISSSWARPPHTFLTVTVPLSSIDVVLLAKGSRFRRMWVCHVPRLKSKSCAPGEGWLVFWSVQSISVWSFFRVYLLTQLTSHVLPPSAENACSDCAVSSVIFQIENRTRICFPLNSSWS